MRKDLPPNKVICLCRKDLQIVDDNASKKKNCSDNTYGERLLAAVIFLWNNDQILYYKAAGNPTVNLLILDIEGAEFGVLKTLPWDKVDIQVLTRSLWSSGTSKTYRAEVFKEFEIPKTLVLDKAVIPVNKKLEYLKQLPWDKVAIQVNKEFGFHKNLPR